LYLFDQTHELDNFNELLIWSDGGPQHFKIKKTSNFFSFLRGKYNKGIEYHFFASNHGHSMCDSHTGVGKQKLRREERSSQIQTKDLDAIADSYSQLKATTVFKLPPIDKTDTVSLSRDILSEGIKKFHEFRYLSNGSVECRIESGVGPIVVQTVDK